MNIIETIIRIAKGEIGTCEPSGDDKYIQVYNALAGTKFNMSVAWCAIFVTKLVEATNGHFLVEAENEIWYDIASGCGFCRSLFY